MLKLPFRIQLVLLGILTSCVVFASLVVLETSRVKAKSEQFAQAQTQLLSHLNISDLAPAVIKRTLFESLENASPVSRNSYVQILDPNGVVKLSVGNAPKISNTSIREYITPLVDRNMEFSEVRIGIDLGITNVMVSVALEMLVYTLPVVLFISIYSVMLERQQLPVINDFKLINKGFQGIPHNVKLKAREPGPAENTHNLKLLIISLHKYLKKLREDRDMFKTSTKVLAYQKVNSESILRSSPQGVLVLKETGQVCFANQQFLRWFRLDADQVLGKPSDDWCERSGMKSFLNRYRGSVARRAESGGAEFDPPGKPGAYLSMTAYPMFSTKTEEQIKSTLVVFSDTTAEVHAEKAREDFATAAAHELKTPLHAIGMHAEMLLTEDGEDNSLRIDSANFINTEIIHIGELVRNMLSITRIETGNLSINRKLTKLDDLLDSLILSMETNASENTITFDKDYQHGIEPCFLDKDLLRVALNNLLSNAIKYNFPGGKVKVSVLEAEHSLTLTVSDTGLGISEDDKSRIFQKFFRSEDTRIREMPGHGLGLSLVKEIVELHGGTINVESTIGKGTDFIVKLKKINVPLKEAA